MSDTADYRRGLPSIAILAICLLACFAAAGIASALTLPQISTWYAGLSKPSFSPPNDVFGPVWTLLYTLMAIAIWRVWIRSAGAMRQRAVAVFALQLVLNIAWSAAFFASHSPVTGLAVILVLMLAIVLTIDAFAQIDRLAAWLLAPYVAWVSFATALNAAIILLNG